MDTLVSTEDGLRQIGEIQAGDYVWSENTETGERELRKVLSVSVTETKALVHVTTENGTVVDTTENHPFYVEGKGWCAAAELEAGDVLRTEDGEQETVKSVQTEKLDKAVKVYNLEIEDSHTYYVSADSVLVHNACGDALGKRQTEDQKALYDLAKEAMKNAKSGKPITESEAMILDQWAVEYGVPQHHQAYNGSGQHFPGGNYMNHTHIYNIHVPYIDSVIGGGL